MLERFRRWLLDTLDATIISNMVPIMGDEYTTWLYDMPDEDADEENDE